jgi:predicted esterase
MTLRFLLCSVLCSLSLIVSASTFDINDWFSNDGISPVALSPSGERILWLEQGVEQALLLQAVKDDKHLQIELPIETQFVDARFSGSNRFLFIVKASQWHYVYEFDIENKKQTLVLKKQSSVSFVNGQNNKDGYWLLSQQQLIWFDFLRRQITQVMQVPEGIVSLTVDSNDNPCLAIKNNGKVLLHSQFYNGNNPSDQSIENSEASEQVDSGKQWHTFDKLSSVTGVKVDASCQKLWALSSNNLNTESLLAYSVSNGLSTLFSNNSFDLSVFTLTANGEAVDSVSYDGQKPEVVTFSPAMAKLKSILNKYNDDIYWEVLDRNNDDSVFLVHAESPTLPPQILWVAIKSRTLKVVNQSLAYYKGHSWYQTIPFSINRFQSGELTGYLTVPVKQKTDIDTESLTLSDSSATKFIIVKLHGGPFQVRDNWRFDPEAQWFAEQGIATLTVNYRGSAGFGKLHQAKAFGQLRETLEQDIDDALDWAREQYSGSEHSICLYGSSFGAFAVLSELIENPDDYSCGIMLSGVSSLPEIYRELDTQQDKELFKRQFGDPENIDWHNENNLLKHIAMLSKPLLVIYGNQDSVVSPMQSERLVEKLKAHSKTFEQQVFPEGQHQLDTVSTRHLINDKIKSFLMKYLRK